MSTPDLSSQLDSQRPLLNKSLRISRYAAVACLLILPALLFGVWHIRSSTAAVAQWLPSGGIQTQRYAQFLEWFDDDMFLVLSWEGCRVDDPGLAQVAQALRDLSEQQPQLSIRRVSTSTELVEKLVNGPTGLTPEEAYQRLQGVFVGPQQAAVLLIEMSDSRQEDYTLLVAAVLDSVEQSIGLTRQQVKLGGGIYEAVMVDQSSDRSLKRFVIPSSLAALAVAWFCLRSLRLTLVVLVIAGYCQLCGLGLIYYLGGQLNAVLIVMPTLVFMLTVSAAVHLINYYRDAGGSANPRAGLIAVRAGLAPCLMASSTTAVGLLSLLVSQLRPVRDFGLYAAIAVVCATSVLLLVFPAVLALASPSAKSAARPIGFPRVRRLAMSGLHMLLYRANRVALLCVLLVVGVGCGLVYLKSTVKVQNMFESKSELLSNYAWLEERVGPLISVEAVLSFAPACALDDLQRAELLAQVHYAVQRIPEVGGVFSALTFMPTLPHSGGMRNTARRAIFRKKLQSQKQTLADEGVVAFDAKGEHWRVTARVPVLHQLDYGQFTDKIIAACQPIEIRAEQLNGVRLTFTGLNPVFHEAQQLLFSDLAASFSMAFLLITPFMMLVLRSVLGGLLAMLPNVAPVAVVFGAMGWLGVPLDIASILTASVALGIAVDDTLHFTTWFSRGRRQGLSATQAIEFAFEKCAGAMLQTTCICCAAMLTFLPTEFIPTRKFAILMSIMLATAVIGDLVLLPALLASRLGRWIYRVE
jgi:predicted RND superfamily exporter protein